MTKRKASIDDDDQKDQDPSVSVLSRGGSANSNNEDCNPPILSESENSDRNRPTSMTVHNGSSSGVLLDGRSVQSHQQQNDNHNDNSNCSSSEAGNNSSNTNIGSNQQQPSKSKKERADNWSSSEIQVLHRGIDSRREVFYGPPSQATKKNRDLAWEAITKEVNAVAAAPRTISQVMKKFKNEKCRAKRKFIDHDKDGHVIGNGSSNINTNVRGTTNNTSNMAGATINDLAAITRAPQATTNIAATNQQQQHQLQHSQAHLMSATTTHGGNCGEQMATPQTSINVVKLAPQNVAKTMIDLPANVQHTIQMPNDDMVLIVPPDMDGILSGVNIVSDGSGHHHFQKCGNNAVGGHQLNNHNQHAIQTLNTNQGLMNGTMGNGMVARTIPAGSMCSLVYSTGNEACTPEHHITGSQATIAPNHIAVSAQNLVHHRISTIDQGLQQHQQPQHQALHHSAQPSHQQHQQQHAQPHPQQQQHQQHAHQVHPHHQQVLRPSTPHNQANTHHQHQHQNQHLTHNHLANSTPSAAAIGSSNVANAAGESQLKNLLFNLLLKDGQQSSLPASISSNQDYSKQRNDMLAIIASSLSKIETHLSKISKLASSFLSTNSIPNQTLAGQLGTQTQQLVNTSASAPDNVETGAGTLTTAANDNNNNTGSFNITNAVTTPSNQRRSG